MKENSTKSRQKYVEKTNKKINKKIPNLKNTKNEEKTTT